MATNFWASYQYLRSNRRPRRTTLVRSCLSHTQGCLGSLPCYRNHLRQEQDEHDGDGGDGDGSDDGHLHQEKGGDDAENHLRQDHMEAEVSSCSHQTIGIP